MSLKPDLRVVYKSVDGQDISTEIYLPPKPPPSNPRDKPYPILINIHGGAWMLGSCAMVNKDQVRDCLSRGWIVAVPQHRLCPAVDLLSGPMRDVRDMLAWIYAEGLDEAVAVSGVYGDSGFPGCDLDNVLALGTSSGGHLALCLGFDVPRPVKGILNFYGPCNFASPAWSNPLPKLEAILPPSLSPAFTHQVYSESPVALEDGISLEGQTPEALSAAAETQPRPAFALTQMARGTILSAVWPSGEWDPVDPLRNVHAGFPPTCTVHGLEDEKIPIDHSRALLEALRREGVASELIEVPDEGHTFTGKMELDSDTYRLQRKGFNFLESLL